MSSPIPRTPGSDPGDVRHGSTASPTSALALSGLLKVQRRWSLASLASLEVDQSGLTTGSGLFDGAGLDWTGDARVDPAKTIGGRQPFAGAGSPVLLTPGGSRLPVHLEDSDKAPHRVALVRRLGAMGSIPTRESVSTVPSVC